MNQVTSFRTVTGREVFFEDPTRTEFNFKDALDQLSRICRYNGVIEFSVLDHLLLCMTIACEEGLSTGLVAYVAAHDMHEYVLGDVPTGLKECLPDYRRLERRWEAHVHEQLGLAYPLPKWIKALVKAVDRRALVAEMSMFNHPSRRETEQLYGAVRDSERKAIVDIASMPYDMKGDVLETILWTDYREFCSAEEGLALLRRLGKVAS